MNDSFISTISIVGTLIIAVSSLIISILSYRSNKPHLKIQIIDPKFDCFFGNVLNSNPDGQSKHRIAATKLRVLNTSSQSISILYVELLCRKDKFSHIDPKNKNWDSLCPLVQRDDSREEYDGCSIHYADDGMAFPNTLNAYCGKDILFCFHDFPAAIRHKEKAIVVIHASTRIYKKNVTLIEYDNRFAERIDHYVNQYFQSRTVE